MDIHSYNFGEKSDSFYASVRIYLMAISEQIAYMTESHNITPIRPDIYVRLI